MRLFALALTAAASLGAASPVVSGPPDDLRRDQVYVVSPEVAEAAVAVFNRHGAVWSLCEPCGDTDPTLLEFENAYAVPWEGDASLRVVMLDGRGMDLAYVFVPLGPSGDAANAAMLLGASVFSVSPTIHVGLSMDDAMMEGE